MKKVTITITDNESGEPTVEVLASGMNGDDVKSPALGLAAQIIKFITTKPQNEH